MIDDFVIISSMANWLILIGGIITILAVFPYLKDVVKGSTKPRIVTWFNWALINAIACTAAFAENQYPAAILMLCATIEVGLVAILGLRYRNFGFGIFDVICQVGVVFGLIAWLMSGSAAVATTAMLLTDLVAASPTIKHTWQKPDEETVLTFVMSAVGAGLIIIAVADKSFVGLAFPVYTFVLNIIFCINIFIRSRGFLKDKD